MLLPCVVQAQDYRMKADEAPTGSLLRRESGRLHVPPDKTYAELPEADKARLRSLYEHMAADDEPPFPARGYRPLMRAMSTVQEQLQVEGTVDMGVIVGPDGRASEVKVYGSSDPQLTTVIASVLVLEKYKPALCRGTPCTQEFPFRMNFTLRH
ncbi:energy transducer TonB [Pseudoduganella umbonata]|uniref:TonB C-terminal domain-containing protein n=1 Tax=Pseudoduganella umbonata TaxID=864828 RepID=A0A4P8HRT4_9BURK|nr:energy transducer TonB [Pseudoduganella umbonata]MBB3222326.1 hypothetical protein [Pseudoduganella umbonata]QCP12543.1 hypothetical protein FCL38_20510 [Pseudoduganella umbonata]